MGLLCKLAIHDGESVGDYILIRTGEGGLYDVTPKVPHHCLRCGHIWFTEPSTYSVSYFLSDAVPYEEAVQKVRERLEPSDA